MKDDSIYIEHMETNLKRIILHSSGISKEDFLYNIQLQDACIRQIEIMGEVTKLISETFKKTPSWIKIFFVILIMIVNGQSTLCQPSFVYRYSTLQDEVPFDAVETADGGYIICAKIGSFLSQTYNTLLIKLTATGDTERTIVLTKSTNKSLIVDLVPSTDGNFFGIGTQEYVQESKIWLLKITSDLQILLDTTYSVGLLDIVYFFGFIDHLTDLIIYGSGNSNNYNNHIYVYRLTQDGDSLSYKYFPDTGNEYSFSMIEKSDSSGYYMAIDGNYQINTNSPGQILTFNNDLDVTDIDSLPLYLSLYYNLQHFNDHQIILTGHQIFPFATPRTDKLAIHKMDTSFVINTTYFLGPWDTISYPGYLHNLDFLNTNNIFLGGTCNQAIADFSSNKSYFMLGNFNSDLNLKWQKYIGGDMYYTLWAIKGASDGGCILMGGTYDYMTQTMERDILIVKVDSNGVITCANGNRDLTLHDVVVYPNPGTTQLNIESGPQISGAKFVLWDMNGNLIHHEKLNRNKIKIEGHSWPSGNYIWIVANENQVIESGKWIKQ